MRQFAPLVAAATLLAVLTPPLAAAEPDVSAMKLSAVKIILARALRKDTGETGVEKGTGSGYLVGGGKYVVTNNHVCCSDPPQGTTVLDSKLIVHHSKDEFSLAKVAWTSIAKDLAVLELERPLNKPDVTFTQEKYVKDGMRIWAIGFPAAAERATTTAESDFIATVNNGIIGKFVEQIIVKDGPVLHTISHSAATNPGNSGGPLFNFCGQVIATNFRKALMTIRQRVQVRDPITGAVVEREVERRVVEADGINWSVRLGELLSELDRLGIKYKVAPDACQEIDKETRNSLTQVSGEVSSMSGRVSALMVTQVGSIALALVAVGLAMNKRVRQSVSRRLSTRRSEPGLGGHHRRGGGPVFTAPKPYLKGLSGFYSGSSIQVEDEPWVLGRDREVSNLVFPGEFGQVSKRHCTISFDESTGQVFLEDTWSSNGTFLANGTRLEPGRPYELRPGDRFYIADKSNLFEISMES